MFDRIVILNADGSKMIFQRDRENDEDRVNFARRVLRLEGSVDESTVEDIKIVGLTIAEDTKKGGEPALPDVVYFRARAESGVDEGFSEASIVVCKGDPRVKAVWTNDPYSIFM
jgi:hypothetical protein